MKPHKQLNSWIKSFELVKEIYLSTANFPAEERFELTSQIRRCAVSIPVNIAEGAARKGQKEFIHFLHISLGSATELDTLLLLCINLGFLTIELANDLLKKLEIICKLIYGLIKKLQVSI